MATSILSDITTALDDQTLERLAEKFDTPALQVRYGIDLAARHILENLVKHSESLEGAQDVYRKIGEFDGTILQEIRGDVEFNGTVQQGTSSLTALVGADVEQLVEVVQTSSDTSQASASNVVGLASALTLDVLGRQKKQLDLNRNGLTEMLRAQTGDTGEPPMRTTDSQHLTQTSPMESFSGEEPTASVTEPFNHVVDELEQLARSPNKSPEPSESPEISESPELSEIPELAESNIPKASGRAKKRPKKVLKAKKTKVVEFASGDFLLNLPKPARTALLIAPVFVIVGTTLCAWRLIDQRSEAIARLIAATRNETQVADPADLDSPITTTDATAEAPDTKEAPATTDVPAIAAVQHRTKPVTFKSRPVEFTATPFQRSERGADGDLQPVSTSIIRPASTKRYPWDETRPVQTAAGKLPAGPWQVPAYPRNQSDGSYFSFR